MNFFQNLQIVRELSTGLKNLRTMSVPTMLFCASFMLACTLTPANGQGNEQNGNGKKGIMCYVCNSARDPRCGDPFDPSTIEKVDCAQFMPEKNATICRKNTQKAVLGSKSDLRVIRTCGYIQEQSRLAEEDQDEGGITEDRCYNKAGTFEVQVAYCACSTDGCNNSPRQAWSSLSLASQTTLHLFTMIAGSYLMLNKSFY